MFVTVGNSCALASSIDSSFIVNFKAEGIRLAWTVGMESDADFMALDRLVEFYMIPVQFHNHIMY